MVGAVAKHLSVLREFRVTESGLYEPGLPELAHEFRDCDWRAGVDGMTLPQVMKLADAHAAVCDGSPQPRPPAPEPGYLNSLVPEIWSGVLMQMLGMSLVSERPGPPGA